jgi:uncharacterized MAPEG superfamily protein
MFGCIYVHMCICLVREGEEGEVKAYGAGEYILGCMMYICVYMYVWVYICTYVYMLSKGG